MQPLKNFEYSFGVGGFETDAIIFNDDVAIFIFRRKFFVIETNAIRDLTFYDDVRRHILM